MTRRTSYGFAPLVGGAPRVLILGSLPGAASIAQQQYYAQAQNAFWLIMGRLFGAGRELPYDQRVRKLIAQRVAVWDVLAAAQRAGSLDASIVRESIAVNDVAALLREFPTIAFVAFNGRTAAELYHRHVHATLPESLRALPTATLPSTSPAHAALDLQAKLARWRVVKARARSR
jgi:hypoxanthine-DNA glycosylase